jgi:hypothetical protein
MDAFKGEMCYVFTLRPRGGDSARKKDNIVVDELVTWFNINTWEIVARKYSLSYKAGVYDFDVHMEVEMTKFGEYLVPQLMRYHGSWDVVFKKEKTGCLRPPCLILKSRCSAIIFPRHIGLLQAFSAPHP